MEFWESLYQELLNGSNIALLYVHRSDGSSPGRQGFKMFVSTSGEMQGSIGGGPMEFKLIELSKRKLEQGHFSPFVQRQIHKSNIPTDKSGMICSGEQTVGIYCLRETDIELVLELINHPEDKALVLTQHGIQVETINHRKKERIYVEGNKSAWKLIENLKAYPELHIVGGGHVSLALSTLAKQLDFKVYTYDTRDNLNTISSNTSAAFTLIPDYSQIGSFISSGEKKYLVLMSFGFRTDKVALQNLLSKDFKYIGMMGSKEKVKTLLSEMIAEGADHERLKQVYAPIGVQIASKTPMEIAVSVMAEIILVKNT